MNFYFIIRNHDPPLVFPLHQTSRCSTAWSASKISSEWEEKRHAPAFDRILSRNFLNNYEFQNVNSSMAGKLYLCLFLPFAFLRKFFLNTNVSLKFGIKPKTNRINQLPFFAAFLQLKVQMPANRVLVFVSDRFATQWPPVQRRLYRPKSM